MDADNFEEVETSELVMGSCPTITFGIETLLGKENISMRTSSIEEFEKVLDHPSKNQWPINPDVINLPKLLMTFFEESNRTYFMFDLRVAMLNANENTDRNTVVDCDPIKLGRYNLLGENCISSAIRNISLAVNSSYYDEILKNQVLKKDIKNLISEDVNVLESSFKIFSTAVDTLNKMLTTQLKSDSTVFDSPINLESAPESVLNCYKLIQERNADKKIMSSSLSLPARALSFIKLITSKFPKPTKNQSTF